VLLLLCGAACPTTRAAADDVRLAAVGGARVDYDRAAGLFARFQGKVRNERISPRWIADGSQFWYACELPAGGSEVILVDCASGRRAPAFDHDKLAAAVAAALDRPVEATAIPFLRAAFDGARWTFLFREDDRAWRYDPAAEALAAVPLAEAAELVMKDLGARRRSVGGSDETFIFFRNQTEADLDLFWIDHGGQDRSYGVLRAGQTIRRQTYAGHVWTLRAAGGDCFGVYQGEIDPGVVVVLPEHRRVEAADEPRERPERGRGGRAEAPDGKRAAFIRDHNVFLTRDAGGPVALSDDGREGHTYQGPLQWSPDSRRLVALRTQVAPRRKIHIIESSPADQVQPKLQTHDYAKPGDEIDHPRPVIFDVASGEQTQIDDALFPNPWSIDQFHWAPDSSAVFFRYVERGHQVVRVIRVDAASGEARVIVDERSPTFVDYAHKNFLHFLDGSGELIWMSERDGWNHLYLCDAAGTRPPRQITRGAWVVRGVDRVDEARREIHFRAGGIDPQQDPYYEHYCRVNIDDGAVVRLTEGDGTHRIEPSPDGRYLIDRWSRVDQPPVTELRRASDGGLVCELERADAEALRAEGWQAPERFEAPGRDGRTPIYGIICRPTNFDPHRKYPVIEHIYAGPHGAHTPKEFRAALGHQQMAELGFVVVQLDGMGTSQRSKAFHDVCWQNLADAGFPDRIAWMRAAAAERPWMDLERVGIYGGSAGGQNAMRALLDHGDFYKVAVADCGCHDNRMDKIWWNELWMGWPVGPQYEASSNVAHADRLTGKLLLIVGELDTNVDPASTMQVVSALVKANKDFDLLVMPGTGHGAAESAYASRRRQDYFVRHLIGVEPRWEQGTSAQAAAGR